MFRQIWAVLTNDPAARADHFDRNSHQQHQLPDHMPDQASVQCLVDDNLTTWLDDPGFQEANAVLGLHEADSQSWRGIPAQPFLDTGNQEPTAPASTLSAIDPDDHSHPSYQLITTDADHRASPSSTYDNINPRDSMTGHFASDVLPHMVWGGGYASYDMSNGEDLSEVDRNDVHANVYPCQNGVFIGGPDFHGIDDPVSAAGQLSAESGASVPYTAVEMPAVTTAYDASNWDDGSCSADYGGGSCDTGGFDGGSGD